MKRIVGTLLICLAAALAAQAQPFDMQALKPLYDYDAEQPLDVKETLLFERDGVKVYDVSYASPKLGRVAAYLVVPPGKGPFAGLVFGHWGQGTHTEFLPEAILYAQAGAVSLLPANPWVRPAPWRRRLNQVTNPEEDLELYSQAVVDLRRGFDLLLARPGVDPARLAYVGHSFGAQFGAILSAVDDRVKAAALVGGVPDLACIYLDNDDPDIVGLRAAVPEEDLKQYLKATARINAVHYVPHAAPTPLLFQFARHERYFDEAAMKRYAAAASEPKSVKWYDTGHDLNDFQALLDRAEFLRDKIGIQPIAPILERKLGKNEKK